MKPPRSKPKRVWYVRRHNGSLVDKAFNTMTEANTWINECGDPSYRAVQYDLVPVKRKAKS